MKKYPAMRLSFLVAFFALLLAAAPSAHSAAGAITWRPIPELPQVLFFEDFEGNQPAAAAGKVESAPDIENGKAYRFSEATISNLSRQGNVANIAFVQTPAKFPAGIPPGTITLDFSIWTEDSGDLDVAMKGKEIYAFKVPVKVSKKWTPCSVKFSQFPKLTTRPEEIMVNLQLLFVPHTAKGAVKILVDDVVVCVGNQKSSELLDLIRIGRKSVLDAERTWAKDGYTFTLQRPVIPNPATPAVAASLPIRRKPKSVLVIAPRPEDDAALLKALNEAATKEKLSGFTFVGAEAPDASHVGGLTDMRTLLRPNIEKFQSQYVLMMMSYKDVQDASQSAESVRMVVERTLKLGCVPIISIPPVLASLGEPAKGNLTRFAETITKSCGAKYVTVIEASAKFKEGESQLVEGELNETGLKTLAAISVSALKHIEANASKRR